MPSNIPYTGPIVVSMLGVTEEQVHAVIRALGEEADARGVTGLAIDRLPPFVGGCYSIIVREPSHEQKERVTPEDTRGIASSSLLERRRSRRP